MVVGDGLDVATSLLIGVVVVVVVVEGEDWPPGTALESATGVVVVVAGVLGVFELGDPPSVMVKVGEISLESPITVLGISRRRRQCMRRLTDNDVRISGRITRRYNNVHLSVGNLETASERSI